MSNGLRGPSGFRRPSTGGRLEAERIPTLKCRADGTKAPSGLRRGTDGWMIAEWAAGNRSYECQ